MWDVMTDVYVCLNEHSSRVLRFNAVEQSSDDISASHCKHTQDSEDIETDGVFLLAV